MPKEKTGEKQEQKEKPIKESTYKYDMDHNFEEDTTITYPDASEGDNHLVKLPFRTTDLQPHISCRTVYHHYTDHHLAYYKRHKEFLKEHPEFNTVPLKKFIYSNVNSPEMKNAVTNATLLMNHNYYWESMKPKGGIKSEKESELTKEVIKTFDSVNKFKKIFITKAMAIGIGWMWLYKTDKELKILRTDYLKSAPANYQPLFAIDVWEHAYYLDYGSLRLGYLQNFLNHLVNWDFAEANFMK